MSNEAIPRGVAVSTRRTWLKRVVGGSAALLMGGGGWYVAHRNGNLFEVRRERTLMQTTVAVTTIGPDPELAAAAIRRAYARMAQAVAVLTRFDPDGPVGKLNRLGHLDNPPSDLRDVVRRSLEISALTDGDFDISVLPVLNLLESLQRPAVLEDSDRAAIAARDRLIDYRHIALDEHGLRFVRPGMAVTLDGLAKGYVIDQGIAALRAAGVDHALIDAGGDLRAIAPRATDRQWRVGIIHPFDANRIAAVVALRNGSLGTSGNYRIFYSADRTLFHVIDPHTGYSPLNYSSVTVMAEDSTDADAMSVAAASMRLPRLHDVMASQNHQWLVFARTGGKSWRSRDLPMVSGSAEVV